ncbi:uncharacterized protein OCT59_024994 [Rhizophagus irregularis]|uniref:uncharacterized protein n=1 Tax=Rhizophagus irregularis TaxID=588596 RepID=UPI0019F478EA|nr:hypothetical protein OCT59_020225 [Rhizophagus irregularis]UZO04619.1 hypothetical protein OCT59_024994 [Rhizophagus irregularis]GET59868.1 hypothetical protein GLOIN_2v1789591 [Rhizophagus irregularis DAOM 181602=DAOM 197198]GET62219.1 hypothetical protein GLOIN_2v1789591 [Rhizophagus irregularis DAOM 181602=DAOM 197198]GET62850.1 hypothetical protein GLOIN_2v1789591 [Rhizophagus irregularis DAOM 181602=DAOM 197198]
MESDQKHLTALTNIPPKSTSSESSSSKSSSSETSSSEYSSSSESSSSESSSSDSDIDEIVNMIKHQRIRKRLAQKKDQEKMHIIKNKAN